MGAQPPVPLTPIERPVQRTRSLTGDLSLAPTQIPAVKGPTHARGEFAP